MEKEKPVILGNEILPNYNKEMEFFPAKFGPYSNKIAELVNELKKEGKLRGTKDGRELRYEITDKGVEFLNKMEKPSILNDELLNKISTMKELTQQWGLQKTLKYVYTHYPEYTPYSAIRGKVIG